MQEPDICVKIYLVPPAGVIHKNDYADIHYQDPLFPVQGHGDLLDSIPADTPWLPSQGHM